MVFFYKTDLARLQLFIQRISNPSSGLPFMLAKRNDNNNTVLDETSTKQGVLKEINHLKHVHLLFLASTHF